MKNYREVVIEEAFEELKKSNKAASKKLLVVSVVSAGVCFAGTVISRKNKVVGNAMVLASTIVTTACTSEISANAVRNKCVDMMKNGGKKC